VSFNATTLYDRNRRLQGVFAAARDITERKQAEKQILELALHDTLTKLPNRHLLNERLAQSMTASQRSGSYSALMFMDLDNFKALNDTHGHYVGDLLLVEVAHRITACVRAVDVVARFGGDEFVVILNEISTDSAESAKRAALVAEKIRAALDEPFVLKFKNDQQTETTVAHHCTASIGVLVFVNHEESQNDVLKWADTAMYQAKDGGGNQIQFHVPLG
jgi:diguanylate cyclase (GGDEF)-like protein